MLRDSRRASLTTHRLATSVAVALLAASIAACGIKGPLKLPDAAPAAPASAPPAGAATDPAAPKSR